MTSFFRVGGLLVVTACASARGTTDTRFTGELPLQITVRGSMYAGSATMKRERATASGTFVVNGPVEVKGTLTGTIGANDMVLDLTYAVTQNACKGTMHLTGPITRALVVEGTTTAQDSCVGAMSGTFKLGKP